MSQKKTPKIQPIKSISKMFCVTLALALRYALGKHVLTNHK